MDKIEEDHRLVLNSLREVGVQVTDVYQLVHGATPREAVAMLVQVLPLLGNNTIKEAVIRALGDKAARGAAARPLITELKRLGGTKPLLSWVIANSLAQVVEPGDFEELQSLVGVASLGKAREMLVVAIARTKHPDAAAELAKLAADEALAGYVVIAAGELGANELRPFVEEQMNSRTPWVRKEAKKALRRLA
ncbi:MAG TPA: hypothetical protein VGF69_17595 [Thermoanaerobaculia bacterium]|jgi:hypothetical protein